MIVPLLAIFSLVNPEACAHKAAPPLESIRSLYKASVWNKDSCRHFIEMLAPYSESNQPLLAGYKAAGYMIMARHVFNPVMKLRLFQQGKSLFEKAIAMDALNIELRFLRYSIQTNCPGFLRYNGHIAEDKKMLLHYVNDAPDTPLRTLIAAYMNRPGLQ